jgi:hypothetical protein
MAGMRERSNVQNNNGGGSGGGGSGGGGGGGGSSGGGGGSAPAVPQSCSALVGNCNAQRANLSGSPLASNSSLTTPSPAECCDACKMAVSVRAPARLARPDVPAVRSLLMCGVVRWPLPGSAGAGVRACVSGARCSALQEWRR